MSRFWYSCKVCGFFFDAEDGEGINPCYHLGARKATAVELAWLEEEMN